MVIKTHNGDANVSTNVASSAEDMITTKVVMIFALNTSHQMPHIVLRVFQLTLLSYSGVRQSYACQICNRIGLIAQQYLDLHNHTYLAHTPSDTMSIMSLQSNAPLHTSSYIGNINFGSQWCLDSGVSHHMTPLASHFTQANPYQGTNSIMNNNGTRLPIGNVGIISLPTAMGNVIIPNILDVLRLCQSLLSI